MRVLFGTKKLRQSLIILIFLVFGWGSGFVGMANPVETEALSETLTLAETVHLAMDRNPTVLDALDGLEIARSNLVLAQEGTFDPTVTISGQLGLIGDLESGLEISVQDTIPLSGIGRKPAALERAEIAVAQAEQALTIARQNAAHQVIAAYFSVLRSKKMIEAARLAENIALLGFRDTQVLLEQGNASRQDLWQAEQKYLEAQTSAAQVESGLSIHQTRLALMIGVNREETDFLQTEFTVRKDSPDRSVYVEFARERHPGLVDLAFEGEKAGIALEEVLEARRPRIGVIGSLREDQWSLNLKTRNPEWDLDWEIRGRFYGDDPLGTPGSPFAPVTSGWGAGIEVSWVPFDGGVGRERERQERIRIEQIERTVQYRSDLVELEIDEAIQEVLDAESRLVLSEMSLDIEQENFLVRGKQLEQGFITDREYLQSEYQLLLARMNYDAAVFDLIVSRARLEQTSGRDIRLETILEN